MNKKKLMVFSMVGIFALALVSAGIIQYFGMFTVNIGVTQPITVNGQDAEYSAEPYNIDSNMAGGEPFLGDAISVENSADFPITVQVTDDSGLYVNNGIDVNYVGKMLFTGKDLYTGIAFGETEEVIYSVTGEEFVATGIPSGYKLIYYPDTEEGWSTNLVNILVYGENTFPSLPDMNIDVGDNYCEIEILNGGSLANPDALVCNGAKLWLVEESYVTALKSGTWTPSSILFETDLITYTVSSTGEVLVPASSTITLYPQYTLDSGLTTGDYTVITKILPII